MLQSKFMKLGFRACSTCMQGDEVKDIWQLKKRGEILEGTFKMVNIRFTLHIQEKGSDMNEDEI